jgi:hypothetical protein
MPDPSGPLVFNPSPETPIHVVGDLSIDHLISAKPHYRRGTPPRDNNTCPTFYNVLAQSNWWTYGGYPFMAHILRSWFFSNVQEAYPPNPNSAGDHARERRKLEKARAALQREATNTIQAIIDLPVDEDRLPRDDHCKRLQHLYWMLKRFKTHQASDKKVQRLRLNALIDKRITREDRQDAISSILARKDSLYWSEPSAHPPLCTVIVDRNFGFRDTLEICKEKDKKDDPDNTPVRAPWLPDAETAGSTPAWPRFICTVDNALPDLKEGMWQELSAHAKHQTLVLVSAKMLRAAGHKLSHRISWEQTVEEFDKLHKDESQEDLAFLREFRWVVVLFGVTGCMLTENLRSAEGCRHTFFHDPNPPVPFYRDAEEDGRMRGNKSLYIAAILDALRSSSRREISKDSPDRLVAPEIEDAMPLGLRNGMRMCQQLYATGMGEDDERWGDVFNYYVEDQYFRPQQGQGNAEAHKPVGIRRPAWWDRNGPGSRVDEDAGRVSVFRPDPSNFIASIPFEPPVQSDDHAHEPWQILGYARFAQPDRRLDWIGTAHRIVLDGIASAMNREPDDRHRYRVERNPPLEPHKGSNGSVLVPLQGPVEQFGNLSAILRADIENFNRIRNLLRNYLRRWKKKQEDQPLSIAVFGPPGTGKSFAVGQIAKSISKDVIKPLTFNVAQFDSTEQLVSALIQVRDANLEGKLPLVFFDEFDSKAPGSALPLGWLKYFLAPMEDGKFLMPNQGVLRVGQGIFVFAGGTHETYRSFAGLDPDSAQKMYNGPSYATILQEQKGTDFISRLRGHVDIPGINLTEGKAMSKVLVSWGLAEWSTEKRETHKRLDSVSNEELAVHMSDVRPYLQRAIIVRSMLQAEGLILPGNTRATIDERVVAAMLRVREYRYGSRSMKAVLKMCRPMHGNWIMPDSIPSPEHLAMHICDEEGTANAGEVRAFLEQIRSPTYRLAEKLPDDGASDDGGVPAGD